MGKNEEAREAYDFWNSIWWNCTGAVDNGVVLNDRDEQMLRHVAKMADIRMRELVDAFGNWLEDEDEEGEEI